MKTIILAIAFITLFTGFANAQNNNTTLDSIQMKKKLWFSIGLEEGLTTGYVSKFSPFVTGLSVHGEYKILKDLGITLNAGYLYFLAKDGEKGLSFIPVMAGLKYNFLPKFYLGGQLGTSFYVGKDSNKTTYLTFAQGLGFQASKQIDIMVKYEGINTQASRTYSFAGLRIAYTFGKNK